MPESSFRFGFAVLAAACLFVGPLVITLGVAARDRGDALNPDSDFILLPEPCDIIHVEHEAESRSSHQGDARSWKCFDKYTYTFCRTSLCQNGTAAWTSTVEQVSRCASSCNRCSSQAGGRFSNGARQLNCWEPSKERNALPDAYRCGNPECIKLLDPADDQQELHSQGTGEFA